MHLQEFRRRQGLPIYARNVRNFLSIVLRVLIAPVVLLGHQLDRLPVTAMWAATIAGQALYDGRPSLGLRLAALWSSLMDYRSSHWLHVGLGSDLHQCRPLTVRNLACLQQREELLGREFHGRRGIRNRYRRIARVERGLALESGRFGVFQPRLTYVCRHAICNLKCPMSGYGS
jgi:hypothetical protein